MHEEGVILSGNVYKSSHVASDTLWDSLCVVYHSIDQSPERSEKLLLWLFTYSVRGRVGMATAQNLMSCSSRSWRVNTTTMLKQLYIAHSNRYSGCHGHDFASSHTIPGVCVCAPGALFRGGRTAQTHGTLKLTEIAKVSMSSPQNRSS